MDAKRFLAAVSAGLLLFAFGCEEPSRQPTTPDDGRGQEETPTEDTSAEWPEIRLEQRWDGFDQPLYVTHAPDGTGRLFVVEKGGRILVVQGGRVLEEPLLDMSDQVSTGSEQGLLGLAFKRDHRESFWVDFTDRVGDTVIRRYDMPLRPHPGTRQPPRHTDILKIQQPYSNHNGGQIEFGPDGYLYIGLGDGGSAGDPESRAQDPGDLLGKILRIDVSDDKGYEVPKDNPLAGRKDARGEIWHLGMRNPWRFSFDSETGDLYIADVGQGEIEEIDFQPAGEGGMNFGWDLYEGTRRFEEGDPSIGDPTPPVAEYTHDLGVSVTGGYVYRADPESPLYGVYLYADYGSGRVWGLRRRDGKWESRELIDTEYNISSFGVDEDGRVYVTDLSGGGVYEVVPE